MEAMPLLIAIDSLLFVLSSLSLSLLSLFSVCLLQFGLLSNGLQAVVRILPKQKQKEKQRLTYTFIHQTDRVN